MLSPLVKKKTENSGAWVCIQISLYLIVTPIAIYLPLVLKRDLLLWVLVIPWVIFFCCDVWFVFCSTSKRTVNECLGNIRSMCNYVSYYIPAAAVISAFSPGVLKKVDDEDSVAVDFLAVGLGASAVTMVWVPIPVYSEIKDGREVATKRVKDLLPDCVLYGESCNHLCSGCPLPIWPGYS